MSRAITRNAKLNIITLIIAIVISALVVITVLLLKPVPSAPTAPGDDRQTTTRSETN